MAGREAELASRAIDRRRRAFEFDKGADGGFVQFDEEAPRPSNRGGEAIGGAVFFVAKPAAEAETFKEFGKSGWIGCFEFQLFADFETAMSVGTGFRATGSGALESDDRARLGGGHGIFGGRRLDTNAEKLAGFGEIAERRIENDVRLVNAAGVLA